MFQWLDMLRALYNYCLRDRIEAYEQVKAPVLGNYCRLDNRGECCPLACSVGKSAIIGYPWKKGRNKDKTLAEGKKYNPRRSAYECQAANLKELKVARPWYKRVDHSVLQGMLRRLDTAFKNFFKDGRGYPKFKRRSKFRSFGYPPGKVKVKGNRIYLPGLGWMRFHLSRPIPDGFAIRSVTVRRKADGWHTSVLLEDKSVPDPATIEPAEVRSAIGVDLGIKKLASTSAGELIPNPQFAKKASRRKAIRQRAASRKVKGSKNRAKAYQKLAKLEQRVANRRADYQWKVANQLVKQADLIVFEDLNAKGMMARCKPQQDPATGKYLRNGQAAKRGLNKAIADAAWGDLKLKVKTVAAKSGILVHEIDPRHTSQTCPKCGYVSPSNRSGEKFACESCGHADDADVNGAINILNRGLKFLGIDPSQLCGVPAKVTPVEVSLGLPEEPGNPTGNKPERRGA